MLKPQNKYRLPVGARTLFKLTPLLLVLLSFAARAEIYSWTDEQGVRHFSDNPPPHFTDFQVAKEIPHDEAAYKRQADAYREMMEEISTQRRMQKETAETEALKKRLEKAEQQSRAAQKKAEEALRAAAEAQAAAAEKQRYREVYVIPRAAIAPYPGQRVTTPPGGYYHPGIPRPY